jgi:flagellar hook assembly protein FlgD
LNIESLAFGFAPRMATLAKGQVPITYATTAPGQVLLKVYDGAGRLVETLVNSVLPAGTQNVTWDARNIANGIYFLRLESENNTATHKLILVK